MDAQLQRPLSKLRALSRLRDGHQRYSAMDRPRILYRNDSPTTKPPIARRQRVHLSACSLLSARTATPCSSAVNFAWTTSTTTTEMDRLPKILEEDAEHLSTLRFDKPFLHMLQLHRAACSLLSARTPIPCSQALTQASGLEIELLNRSPLPCAPHAQGPIQAPPRSARPSVR